MLGPFKNSPIENLHVSPFLTHDKPGSSHRRVIVDLSFPHGYSVNAGVQSDIPRYSISSKFTYY